MELLRAVSLTNATSLRFGIAPQSQKKNPGPPRRTSWASSGCTPGTSLTIPTSMEIPIGLLLCSIRAPLGTCPCAAQGPNELPSDIQGVVWTGIDNGINAAGEETRREVAQFGAVPDQTSV